MVERKEGCRCRDRRFLLFDLHRYSFDMIQTEICREVKETRCRNLKMVRAKLVDIESKGLKSIY